MKGYYELLDLVFSSWDAIGFSENTIKTLHRDLLKYASKDEGHRGEYKKQENRVDMIDASGNVVGTVFETTPAFLTPIKARELVTWTIQAFKEKTHHPLLIIGNFIVEFLRIHPFVDGNGRLSRILTNLMLLQKDYLYMPYVSHEKYIENNKAKYYLALRKSQKTFGTDSEDVSDWLDFFLSVVLEQSIAAIDLISSEDIAKLLSNKQLLVWDYLQSVSEATPREMAEVTGVLRPTINQVTKKLMQLKKIEQIGYGRSTRYRKL